LFESGYDTNHCFSGGVVFLLIEFNLFSALMTEI